MVDVPVCNLGSSLFSANTNILASSEFRAATSYNAPFADSLADVQDFWNIPEFNDLLSVAQKYLAEAIDGKLDATEALAAIATAQEAILQDAGRLP